MSRVIFCAIDASISCTAISLLRCSEDDSRKFEIIDKVSIKSGKVKFATRWDKKVAMYEMFARWLDSRVENIAFSVFENYSYGSPGHLADLGELNGLYKKYLSDHSIPIDVIAPGMVKRIIADNGVAIKSKVAKDVLKFLVDPDNANFNNFDESDSVAVGIAYCINMFELLESGGAREQE